MTQSNSLFAHIKPNVWLSPPDNSHIYAPTERSQSCMQSVIHQLRPLCKDRNGTRIRTVLSNSPHPDKTPPSHHTPYRKQTIQALIHSHTVWMNLHTNTTKEGDLCSPLWSYFWSTYTSNLCLHTLQLLFSNKHTHGHMHPLSFKGIPALSFKMQGDDI